MPRLKNTPPSYRLHKPSGHAVVTFLGRDHYLGKYGTVKSREEYTRLVAQWAATTSMLAAGTLQKDAPRGDLRLCELLKSYLEFAEQYYRKDGRPAVYIATSR